MDAEKFLADVKLQLQDEIIEDFVRELLENLRAKPEDEEWVDRAIEWLVDEIWGDPGASDS
jgi:hypothetical protein